MTSNAHHVALIPAADYVKSPHATNVNQPSMQRSVTSFHHPPPTKTFRQPRTTHFNLPLLLSL